MFKRVALATLLAIAALSAFRVSAADTFNDVPSGHLNQEAINYLQDAKVIQGYSDGTYKPANRINRAEFVKIVVASQVATPSGSDCFSDVAKEWFAPFVCTAKRLGYIQGYPDGTFKPGEFINFAEASKIVDNALKVSTDTSGTNNEWFAGFVNGLAKRKAIPSTVQFFDKDVSRGEMAEIVWRLKANVTDKVSQTYEGLTSEFPSVKTCEALKEKFDEYKSQQYYPMYGLGVRVMEEMAVPTAAPTATKGEVATDSAQSAGAPAGDFSTTNIQVAGVDEADVIKNDGKYIYMVKGDTVRIVDAYPPKNLLQVGEVTFGDENFHPQEMFVDGNKMVVIGQVYATYYPYPVPLLKEAVSMIMPPRPFQGPRTKVYLMDLTSHSKPTVVRSLIFDGDYNTSRRIGNKMYLVLNDRPNYWILDDVKTGDQILPQFKDGDKAEEPMVKCADIHYFPGYAQPNYLIVASIPLDSADGVVEKEVMLGSGENVYSSVNNLYVATNEVNYGRITDWDWHRDQTNTLVFKFTLNDGKIAYDSRGKVPGHILNQFSMDERGAWFRIATTIESWDSQHPSGNNVYVMDEGMKTVGKLEELAPGERIYSTRFLGDRLYMVTFRRVDPLFVISLVEPTDPKILGKLKIPGFSDYLHPYDSNHILGFGKETEETKEGWVKQMGFKMALFDVSDVNNPVQQFVETIGDQGTDSELLRNHKALLFDKDKNLLAFPITIVEKISTTALDCAKYRYSTCPGLCEQRCIPSSCTTDAEGRALCTTDCDGLGSCTSPSYEQYNTTFSGAMVYSLDALNGFKLRGRVTHYTDVDMLKMGDYWPYDYNKNIQRLLYMDDVLYSVSQSMVKANDINTVKELNSVKLD